MHTRTFPLLIALLIVSASAAVASAQTPLPGGHEIHLLAGYEHQPLQGIDSIVGKIVKKDGLEIMYEIGRVPAGGFALGGDWSNAAARVPEANRRWLKEQTIGGRKFTIAYGKDDRLTISSAGEKQGINLSAVAKDDEQVAEVVLMGMSFGDAKAKE
jgi:hypothetical protein